MSATIKKCYSPSGMAFTTKNVDHVTLTDCPACKFGTVDLIGHNEWKCADCGHEFLALPLKQGNKPKHTQ